MSQDYWDDKLQPQRQQEGDADARKTGVNVSSASPELLSYSNEEKIANLHVKQSPVNK